MKIYTRKGDNGETGLLGGKRVPKSDLRISAYGTVDELNSYIGLLRDHKELTDHKELLLDIQNQLFIVGSHLATEPGKSFDYVPDLDPEEIVALENAMDTMEESLPPMKHFILPGGNKLVSYIHIARCVCRRAEREVISLGEKEEIPIGVVGYLNRLSDYIFVLSRTAAQLVGAEEVPWIPRK